MEKEVKDTKIDILVHLPIEISLKILHYLSGKDLALICQVSKQWRDICNYNNLWKNVCLSESICEVNETMRTVSESETDEHDLEPQCKWAEIYLTKMRLLASWAIDKYTWLAVDLLNTSADIYHNILAVAYWVDTTPTVDILDVKSTYLQKLQTISLPFSLPQDSFGVWINGSILIIALGNVSVIYRDENGKFVYEVLIAPVLNNVCFLGEEQEFVNKYYNDERCWTLCLAERFIWYQAASVVLIYDRDTKTFENMNDILQVVAVEKHGKMVVVQCPHSVRVFHIDGNLLHTCSSNKNSFYTGLVMSSTSFAYLQSEDFNGTHVVQVELSTWQTYKETQLKVYRITLHKNILLLLAQDPFTLTSISHGCTNWSKGIRGTKYLRPGKDFFTVICSKFVFVCPSLARLDMFSLYDVNNGNHLYDTSLGTSSYNIQTVTDMCLVVWTKQSSVNIRSYV